MREVWTDTKGGNRQSKGGVMLGLFQKRTKGEKRREAGQNGPQSASEGVGAGISPPPPNMDTLASLFILGAMGWHQPSMMRRQTRRKVVRETVCALPGCEEMTSHNGGYCCAEHCKEHRGQ